MPLPQINLDDRTFDQLAAEARSLIPRYFPAWTDYNESDPGTTLLELFAYFAESLIYQLNRVPERSLERFAGLVGTTRPASEPIEETMRRAFDVLTQQYRAITESNYEALALQASPGAIARSRVLVDYPPSTMSATVIAKATGGTIPLFPVNTGIYGLRSGAVVSQLGARQSSKLAGDIGSYRNISRIDVTDANFASGLKRGDVLQIAAQANVFPADQFVKVIIVPADTPRATGAESQALRQQVYQFLSGRRLIAAKIKVVPPDFTSVAVTANVVRDKSSRLTSDAVKSNVLASLTTFLDPLKGGAAGTGWIFGRSVYRSEVESVIQQLDGVDLVQDLLLNGDANAAELKLSSALSLVNLNQLTVTVESPN